MKSDRHQGNALTGASIKMTNTRYNKFKRPDKSELLTKDLLECGGNKEEEEEDR